MDLQNNNIESNRNLTHAELRMLRNISLLKIQQDELLTKKKLSQLSGCLNNDMFFKLLENISKLGVINIKTNVIGNCKIIEINNKKLRDYIDEQSECEKWFEYFKKYHICSWG